MRIRIWNLTSYLLISYVSSVIHRQRYYAYFFYPDKMPKTGRSGALPYYTQMTARTQHSVGNGCIIEVEPPFPRMEQYHGDRARATGTGYRRPGGPTRPAGRRSGRSRAGAYAPAAGDSGRAPGTGGAQAGDGAVRRHIRLHSYDG